MVGSVTPCLLIVFWRLKSRYCFLKFLIDSCSNYPEMLMILDLTWPALLHFFPQALPHYARQEIAHSTAKTVTNEK